MILSLANLFSTTTDLPRTRVVLTLALLSGISFMAGLGVLSAVMREPILIDSRTKTFIAAGVIAALNFFLIFYKERYKKVEDALSATWEKDKSKNIFITVTYVIITAVFVWLAMRYIMSNPFKK